MLEVSKTIFNNAAVAAHTNYIIKINTQLINKLQQIYKIMRRYYNKHHFNKEFQEKNIIILRHTNINTKQNLNKGCRKLNYKKFKSYYIKYKWGLIIYKLNLSKSIKIHFTFYINILEQWYLFILNQSNSKNYTIIVKKKF